MASKLLSKSVTGNKEAGYDFVCPVNDGTCGDRVAGVSFSSTGWPTRAIAEARGEEHFAEHKGEGTVSTLEEFRAKHGLAPSADGQRALVTAKDL